MCVNVQKKRHKLVLRIWKKVQKNPKTSSIREEVRNVLYCTYTLEWAPLNHKRIYTYKNLGECNVLQM